MRSTALVARGAALGVPVLSPIVDGWLDGQPATSTSKDGYTPSPAGAQHLADRLAAALRSLHVVPAPS